MNSPESPRRKPGAMPHLRLTTTIEPAPRRGWFHRIVIWLCTRPERERNPW